MELVIASTNLHKIREFREMLKFLKGIELLSLLDFPDYEAPEETEPSFFGNAALKARKASSTLKKWALADDSGLVVPRLQGAPGVYSARYAGENATDSDNRKKLLDAMKHMTDIDRSAYFECCLVLCSPEGQEKSVTGTCEGYLITEERGRNGFGYDSLFIKNGYDKTFAELKEDIKNRISHRYKALEKLSLVIESLKL